MKHPTGRLGTYRAQIPIRLTDETKAASNYILTNVDAHSGYQAQQKCIAAKRYADSAKAGMYIALGISGAATPVGFGGIIADLIEHGLVDLIISTGANVYHDLHFACGLPVRHGTHNADDDKLASEEITRIYTHFIHNRLTLKMQDMINQRFAEQIRDRLTQPYSSATLLNEFGKEMYEDKTGIVVDKKGSFIVRAAEFGVPVFMDSSDNHSLGMDLALFATEDGQRFDPSPSQDVLEAAAYALWMQPQFNVFFGEGGPRNKIQTTGPTASEIFYIPGFEGAEGLIRFTTAQGEWGALSGSTAAEAKSWGKYPDANPERETAVWSEYTLTVPTAMGYVAHNARRDPRRLMDKRQDVLDKFLEAVKDARPTRIEEQEKLWQLLPSVQKAEIQARKAAGYKFDD
ncbi:MAG: deoxyhypusine synthase family protein [Candidatus Aenigmarchaeota archaeon]|nr:deoxyhypusine synthase family protein [Candidatus Aenigmarchaeota archaeon]